MSPVIVSDAGEEHDQEHESLFRQRANDVQNNGHRSDGSAGASGGRQGSTARKEPPAQGEGLAISAYVHEVPRIKT